MKKKIMAVLLAIVMALVILCNKPIIRYNVELSTNYKTAVESQSKGLYSSKLWLVPVYVSVGDMQENKVFYTIYYFPFGTVEMSYTESDGYNIEKELSRI